MTWHSISTHERNDRFSASLGHASILLPLVMLFIGLQIYPSLASKFSAARGGNPILFQISYGAILVAVVLLIRRHQRLVLLWQAVTREPLLALLFFGNLTLTLAIGIVVLTKFGVVIALLCCALITIRFCILPESHVVDRLAHVFRRSLLSFAVIYLLIIGGEVYLRFNPSQVGGGGGGNPALRRIYAGRYTKNRDGLRGPEIVHRPEQDLYRILAVGDSFTFGQGVADDQTYPFQLSRLFNTVANPSICEVVNGGKSGTNTQNQLEFVRDFGLSLQPDLITVQFYLNDLEPQHEGEHPIVDGLVDRLLMEPVSRSYALFFLKHRYETVRDRMTAESHQSTPAEVWIDGLLDGIKSNGPGWQAFGAAVDQFSEIVETEGVPVYFVLYPHPGGDLAGMRDVHAKVAQRIRNSDLPVIDLLDAFGDLTPDQQIVSEMDHHPSAAMHGLAAREIYSMIRREQSDLKK